MMEGTKSIFQEINETDYWVRPRERFLDTAPPPLLLILYKTTFTTIFNYISIYLGLGQVKLQFLGQTLRLGQARRPSAAATGQVRKDTVGYFVKFKTVISRDEYKLFVPNLINPFVKLYTKTLKIFNFPPRIENPTHLTIFGFLHRKTKTHPSSILKELFLGPGPFIKKIVLYFEALCNFSHLIEIFNARNYIYNFRCRIFLTKCILVQKNNLIFLFV